MAVDLIEHDRKNHFETFVQLAKDIGAEVGPGEKPQSLCLVFGNGTRLVIQCEAMPDGESVASLVTLTGSKLNEDAHFDQALWATTAVPRQPRVHHHK